MPPGPALLAMLRCVPRVGTCAGYSGSAASFANWRSLSCRSSDVSIQHCHIRGASTSRPFARAAPSRRCVLLGERPDGYHGGTSTEFISNRADGRSCFSAALRLRRGASTCRPACVAALLPAYCLLLTLGKRPAASLSAQQDSSQTA